MSTVAELLATRITEQAARTPRAPALTAVDEFGNEENVSWRELDAVTAERAHGLVALRERCQHPVVYLRASADLHSALVILSCLRASVPVLALTTAGGADFEHSVLDTVARSYGIPVHEAAVETWAAGHEHHGDRRVATVASPRPLFILTSSGSTGTPKVIAHWSLFGTGAHGIRNLMLMRSGFRGEQRQLLISSLYHFISFTSLVEGVSGGGLAVLQRRFDASRTLTLLESHEINWLMLNPMQMGEIVDLPQHPEQSFTAIRGVLHGAGPCPRDVKREWLRLVSPGRLFETYGATEGNGATLTNGHEWLQRPGTVGRGFLTHTSVHARDGSRCAPGEVGHVYLRQMTASDEITVQRPWLHQRAGGWQSLGDLGWMDQEGYLFIAGRESDQIHGAAGSITPAKIDAALYLHPGVRDAMTFIVESEGSEPVLRAVVVPRRGAELDESKLLGLCARELSPAEMPASVVLAASLSRSEVGKIRRRVSTAEYEALTMGRTAGEG